MQGIAALNAPQAAPQTPAFSEADIAIVDRGISGAVRGLNPQYRQQLNEIVQELNQMSAEELSEILRVIAMLEADPQNYAQNLLKVADETGIDTEDLPKEYNPVFFKMLKSMVQQAMTTAQPNQMQEVPESETPAFAEGGIVSLREMARNVANAGRNGDTMLAHITPREAEVLKRMGGAGSINPRTGLREYFLKKVGKFLKSAAPVIGTIALGIVSGGLGLSLSPAVIGAVGSGVGSLVAGAKPAEALRSAVFGGLSMGVASGVGSMLSGGQFMSGFGSAFPSAVGGSFGETGTYDLMGGVSNALGFGQATPQPGLPTTDIPMPPIPDRAVAAAGNVAPVSSTAGAAKAAEAGSGGGLGGLFSDKFKTAALIGGGAALLAGLGASDKQKATPLIRGQTGFDLLKQNPGAYGFNVADFRPKSTTAPTTAAPSYISTPMVAPQPGIPFNFQEVQYPRLNAKDGGHINGPGTGTSDSIPARLSDGEFVMTAAAVRGAGGGDRMKGARKMYELMHKFERMA